MASVTASATHRRIPQNMRCVIVTNMTMISIAADITLRPTVCMSMPAVVFAAMTWFFYLRRSSDLRGV